MDMFHVSLPDNYSGSLQVTTSVDNLLYEHSIADGKIVVAANNGKADIMMTNFSDQPINSRKNVSVVGAESIANSLVYSVEN